MPSGMRPGAPAFAGIWWWHTIEEIEHKSVAFDLYREVTAGRRVAYPRRAVAMTAVCDGQAAEVQAAQAGTVTSIPELPAREAASTAQWTARVLAGAEPVPAPIAAQLAQVLDLAATACPNVPRHAAFAA